MTDDEHRSYAFCYARYGGPEVLEAETRLDPQPGPGQVRLAVRAAAVNPFDHKLRDGLLASSEAPDAPVVPGTDVAGVVEALGEGVTAFAVGDEVLGRATGGAYAEKTLAAVDEIVVKPSAMSWEVAGALEVAVHTARSALDELALLAGAVLLVHGASGGVGTMAVQAAVADGLRVVGTAGPTHREYVASLGATPVVRGDALRDRVREAVARPESDGPAVDGVLDLAGHGDLADLVALAGGPERVVTVADPQAPRYGVRFVGRRWVPGALADAAARAVAGHLRTPRTVPYPLEQARQAMEDDRAGVVDGRAVLVATDGS
ncbi:NADP-dependent oxidoreductase [Actinomycetospora termitidis]|uniref:NADP-dependent oxidoreductase n=1 Tax=Actinomycetospora termitidis TaxID=3053470 RepID=A0ABT7MCE8_9PSEU|nr:NADP-dependent oxidoreductase [Actinomycetospora sp. Odt1-22]MDL5158334.1 NADP-dependent oxidoreductase [Actinomycetospora sp. Odt1-22]